MGQKDINVTKYIKFIKWQIPAMSYTPMTKDVNDMLYW